MNAVKRELYKEIEISGRKWRIGRFDAMTGSYITMTLLMQMLPAGLEAQLGISLSSGRGIMSKQTFFDIQSDCLKVCSEIQQVGNTSAPIMVMLPDGRWGVGGIEDDIPLIMNLTIHALIFNVMDFFQEGALKDLGATVQGLSQFSAKE